MWWKRWKGTPESGVIAETPAEVSLGTKRGGANLAM